MLNTEEIKKEFPILKREINGKPLVYLDNASTAQKPKSVISALTNFYSNTNANVHRGMYALSEEASELYESARKKTANFISARSEKEIIFTRNATEAINLIAYTWGETNIEENDEIIVSELEHHSNLVPWQELCKRKNAKLKVIPIKNDLTLDMEKYEELLSERTKLVSVSAMSNVTGTITDIKKIIEKAHEKEVIVCVDGAQSVSHQKTDVQKLDCDFFAFSSHKMLGPTGIGVLYGKSNLLEEMPPFLFGGDMIKSVEQFSSTFNEIPYKFEAGTPNIADVVAFQKAIEFLEDIGLPEIEEHEKELLKYAKEKFSKYEKVKMFSPNNPEKAGGILSFTIEGIHPHDIAVIFNSEGVAIRSGQHCAEPLMKKLKIPATARMSFYLYNTKEDVDQAEKALQKTIETFK